MNEVYEFLKSCGTYYLATVDDGKARVRPFGTINIFEDKLYIQTGKSKNVAKQIEKNNNVEICCFKDGEWLRLSGELIKDDRVEAKKDMLDHYPDLRNMYDENDDNTVVYYFKNAIASISSFTSDAKHIKL